MRLTQKVSFCFFGGGEKKFRRIALNKIAILLIFKRIAIAFIGKFCYI